VDVKVPRKMVPAHVDAMKRMVEDKVAGGSRAARILAQVFDDAMADGMIEWQVYSLPHSSQIASACSAEITFRDGSSIRFKF
jgi:hypothetical protein